MVNDNSNENSMSNATRKLVERNRSIIEGKAVARFLNVLHRSLDGQHAINLEDSEISLLRRIINFGVMEGTLAGLCTFTLLRISRGRSYKILARRNKSSGTSPFSQYATTNQQFQGQTDALSKAQHLPSFVPDAGLTAGKPPRPGLFVRAIGLVFDTFVGFTVAASVTSFMLNPKEILSKFSSIPLIEGRSTISQVFCKNMVSEYNKIQKEAKEEAMNENFDENKESIKDILENPKSFHLKYLLDFCVNCQKRMVYEKMLMQQYDTSITSNNKKLPPPIPSPGVPSDLVVDDYISNDNFTELDDMTSKFDDDTEEWDSR